MPVYEYYCRNCEQKFDLLRPMGRSDEPAECPEGHKGATRTIAMFAAIGRGGEEPSFMPMAGGGCACGGGGCGCGH